MSFKNIRKAASSFFSSKKPTNTHSGFDKGTIPLLRSSVDTIRPAAIPLGCSILLTDVNGDTINVTGDQGKEEESHSVDGQKRRGSEGWEEDLQCREQTYLPPKLDDEEYVIEIKAGYILTSRRRLALWNRGWVNLNTWFEDEMKKMDEDPEYQPMGCGL